MDDYSDGHCVLGGGVTQIGVRVTMQGIVPHGA